MTPTPNENKINANWEWVHTQLHELALHGVPDRLRKPCPRRGRWLIGGTTVLGGDLFAEYLARKRDQANRFDDAVWRTLIRALTYFTHPPRPSSRQ